MGLHVGDNPAHVLQNRERLAQKMAYLKLLFMHQVHGERVVVVDANTPTPTCDAMISQDRTIGLCVMAADCIPILFYDAVTQSFGVAHSGRAGSLLRIGSKTVHAMQTHFGVNPKTLHVYMGPSIKVCCYEVGVEAMKGLEHVACTRDERIYLDLQTAVKEELLASGVMAEHLFDEGVCTCCQEGYFSYRAQKETGRFVGVIGL